MKRLLASFLAFATLTTPLLAAKKSTVTITENVTVGLTQIRAGEYKLSYEGEGPTVKVTLTRDGGAPVVLDAKLRSYWAWPGCRHLLYGERRSYSSGNRSEQSHPRLRNAAGGESVVARSFVACAAKGRGALATLLQVVVASASADCV